MCATELVGSGCPATKRRRRFACDHGPQAMNRSRPILDAIYHLFIRGGDWPTFNVLDHHADKDLHVDAEEALKELEPGLALFDPYMQPASTVALTVAGIGQLDDPEAATDLDAFWALVQFALQQ